MKWLLRIIMFFTSGIFCFTSRKNKWRIHRVGSASVSTEVKRKEIQYYVFTILSDVLGSDSFTREDRPTSAFQCHWSTPAASHSSFLEAADMKPQKGWLQRRWWSEEEESTGPPATRRAEPWRLLYDSRNCCSPKRFVWRDQRRMP